MTNIISATDLKNRLSEVLNSVYYNETIAVIEKHGRPIAKIIPVVKHKKMNKQGIKKVLDDTFGSIPDFPDVTSYRKFRIRKISLD